MYRRISGGWVKHLDFVFLDCLCMQISLILAYGIRMGWSSPYTQVVYRNIGLFLLGADVVILTMCGLLNNILKRGYWEEFKSCFKSTAILTLASTCYLFFIQGGEEYSRIVMVLTGAIYFILSFLCRCLWKWQLRRSGGLRTKNAMLIAAKLEEIPKILEHLESNPFNLPTVTGIVLLDSEDAKPDAVSGIPVVATGETVADYICNHWVDELLITNAEASRSRAVVEQLEEIADSGVAVHRAIELDLPHSGRKQMVEKFAGYTVLTDSVKIVSMSQAVCKRTMDILGGLAGCLICGVALLVVGPMIYLQSPGPIIFKQKRVGRNGKIFTVYKMRSMVMDAEKRKKELLEQNRVSDGMMFKLEFDPRIIGCKVLPDGTVKKGIGNYIRDFSIDELPQFWNVLKGDMSLVGTRPPTLDEWEKYQLHHRARMAFRPGITGMWQVSGRSEITDFEEVVRLDTKYINEWNIGLDLRILLKTVAVVLKREGSM